MLSALTICSPWPRAPKVPAFGILQTLAIFAPCAINKKVGGHTFWLSWVREAEHPSRIRLPAGPTRAGHAGVHVTRGLTGALTSAGLATSGFWDQLNRVGAAASDAVFQSDAPIWPAFDNICCPLWTEAARPRAHLINMPSTETKRRTGLIIEGAYRHHAAARREGLC